jgi:hypothetical protein
MEMLALRDGPGVSESDVMDHYLAHRADYTLPESVSFRHVFFSAATHGADAHAAAEAALGGLRDGGAPRAGRLGDPPPTPPEVSDWTRPMVADRFGMDFAASVFAAEAGGWSGPVASAYGYHLVFVSGRAAARWTSRRSPSTPSGWASTGSSSTRVTARRARRPASESAVPCVAGRRR